METSTLPALGDLLGVLRHGPGVRPGAQVRCRDRVLQAPAVDRRTVGPGRPAARGGDVAGRCRDRPAVHDVGGDLLGLALHRVVRVRDGQARPGDAVAPRRRPGGWRRAAGAREPGELRRSSASHRPAGALRGRRMRAARCRRSGSWTTSRASVVGTTSPAQEAAAGAREGLPGHPPVIAHRRPTPAGDEHQRPGGCPSGAAPRCPMVQLPLRTAPRPAPPSPGCACAPSRAPASPPHGSPYGPMSLVQSLCRPSSTSWVSVLNQYLSATAVSLRRGTGADGC